MKEEIFNILLQSTVSLYDSSTGTYVPVYYQFIDKKNPRFGMEQPTYRQIAKMLGKSQREVAKCMKELVKEGRAKLPEYRYKVGTVKCKIDGYVKELTMYAGGNCFMVWVDRFGDIYEVFDSKSRFWNSVQIYTYYGTPYATSGEVYLTEDFIKWDVNIHESAWPGDVVYAHIKPQETYKDEPEKKHKVTTYSLKV